MAPQNIDITADLAFTRYEQAFLSDALIQGSWHTERDGRQLACGLGVLGPDVNSPGDCPATVMPRWLAQMVPYFFDRQTAADAKSWGLKFYAELKRLNGNVPFSVIHDWQAHVVAPMAIEVATKRARPTDVHDAVKAIHERALAGDLAPKDEWVATLRSAYAYAYAYADANANAYADADAYAYAYADANANAYANANANANAYAYAYANANAYAYANANAVKRLADGMVECLARVSAEV
jgi:hypothetical protein